MAILQLAFCFILISFSNSVKHFHRPKNSTNSVWAHRPHRCSDPVHERIKRDTVGNVQFDLPDLAISWDAGNGASYQLEAFRDKRNEQLLNLGKFNELRWVSLGQPRLVKALWNLIKIINFRTN